MDVVVISIYFFFFSLLFSLLSTNERIIVVETEEGERKRRSVRCRNYSSSRTTPWSKIKRCVCVCVCVCVASCRSIWCKLYVNVANPCLLCSPAENRLHFHFKREREREREKWFYNWIKSFTESVKISNELIFESLKVARVIFPRAG